MQLALFFEPVPVDELRPGDVVNARGHGPRPGLRGPIELTEEVENPHAPDTWRDFLTVQGDRVSFSRRDYDGPHCEPTRRMS